MAVTEKTLTDGQKKSDEGSRAEAEGKVKESILDGLDLSAEEGDNVARGNQPKPKEKEERKEEGAEEGEEAEGEEGEGEEAAEEEGAEDAEDEEDLSPDGDDDEVVSKKKVNKRISSLLAENRRLRAEKEAAEAEKNKEPEDPDTKKLNAMSMDGLKATRKAVAIAIAKEKDDARLEKLIELQDKVDSAIQSAPQRFESRQVAAYDKVADRIAAAREIDLTKETATALKKIALNIYTAHPEFHTLEKGMAIALELAYEHYKASLSKSAGKEKVNELKRQNNTLKRKTGLDSSRAKGTPSKDAVVKTLRDKAFRGGTSKDKAELIKNDPAFNLDGLIPDQFKEESE